MITQAMLDTDSTLKQLPYMTQEIIQKLSQNNIEDVVDFMNMEDDER